MFENDVKYYSMPEYTQQEIIKLDTNEHEKLYARLNQHSKITERLCQSCNRIDRQPVSMSKSVEQPLDVVTDLTYNQILTSTDTNVKCKKS